MTQQLSRPAVLPVWAESGDKVQPSNPEIQLGWPQTHIPPSRQRFNWIFNHLASGLAYLLRRGLSDWSADETYFIGDWVQFEGQLWVSIADANFGSAPEEGSTKWKCEHGTSALVPDTLIRRDAEGRACIAAPESDTEIANKAYVNTAVANISPAVPVGTVIWFANENPPDGFLICNGAVLSRTVYADLFAAIGVTFGVGDSVSTFVLPDLRGEFVRGWDAGREVDEGRVFGAAQGDAIRNITGSLYSSTSGSGATFSGASGTFSLTDLVQKYPASATGNWNFYHTANFNASAVVPTAPDNRPRNIALLPCIKY
jgi:microcystin-dependent protein